MIYKKTNKQGSQNTLQGCCFAKNSTASDKTNVGLYSETGSKLVIYKWNQMHFTYPKLIVALVIKRVGAVEVKHFAEHMRFVWKFHITGYLAKRIKVLEANTARKGEQLYGNPNCEHDFKICTFPNSVIKSNANVSTSEKRARRLCKWTLHWWCACWIHLWGGALFEHNQRWHATNKPRLISPLTLLWRWSRS